MQDRPTAAELAGALEATLGAAARREGGATPFELRVAAHVAGLLAREAAAGPEPVAAEGRRLAGLMRREADLEPPRMPSSADAVRVLQAEMARALRAGELDGGLDAVADALRPGLAERLAVAHPGWDEVADDGRG